MKTVNIHNDKTDAVLAVYSATAVMTCKTKLCVQK